MTGTPFEVRVLVYRRLDNRSEGLSDESPRALELHNLRKDALHQAFEGVNNWKVKDWGGTDDPFSHELIEIALSIISVPQFHAAVVAVATWASLELAKAGFSALATETVKGLLFRLIPKQEERKILDFMIELPDGTIVRCDEASKVTITFQDQRQSRKG